MELSSKHKVGSLELYRDGDLEEIKLVAREYGSGDQTLGIVAGAHGDEKGPQQLVEEFIEDIEADIQVSVINPANVPAAQDYSRETPSGIQQNLADEADLNRSWRRAQKFLNGELEKYELNTTAVMASHYLRYLKENTDLVIDLHTGTYPTRKTPQFRYIEGDSTMADIAGYTGTGAVLETDHQPEKGTLRSTLYSEDIPAATIEIGGASRPGDNSGFTGTDGRNYRQVIKRIVNYLSGEKPCRNEYTVYHDIEKVYAPAAGIVRYESELGEEVKSEDTVAIIEDPNGDVRAEIEAGYDGMVETLNTEVGRKVNENNRLVNIAVK